MIEKLKKIFQFSENIDKKKEKPKGKAVIIDLEKKEELFEEYNEYV